MSTDSEQGTKPLLPLAQRANWEQILERIAAGEYQNKIAAELGISPGLLTRHLKNIDQEAVAIARETGIELRLDQGLDRLERTVAELDRFTYEDCDRDAVNLARTRISAAEATLKRLEWRASVELPQRWGQRPNQVQVNAQGPVQVIVQDSWTEPKTEHNPDPEDSPRGPYSLLQDKSAEDGGG